MYSQSKSDREMERWRGEPVGVGVCVRTGPTTRVFLPKLGMEAAGKKTLAVDLRRCLLEITLTGVVSLKRRFCHRSDVDSTDV